jgi:hypothetical protein
MAMATAAATERTAKIAGSRPGGRGGSWPDRLTVLLLTLAGILIVLALLASQLRPTGASAARRPVVVLRRIYQTTVVETAPGTSGAGANGTSVTQSVSSSGSAAAPAAPTTRSS